MVAETFVTLKKLCPKDALCVMERQKPKNVTTFTVTSNTVTKVKAIPRNKRHGVTNKKIAMIHVTFAQSVVPFVFDLVLLLVRVFVCVERNVDVVTSTVVVNLATRFAPVTCAGLFNVKAKLVSVFASLISVLPKFNITDFTPPRCLLLSKLTKVCLRVVLL